jgi:hypothetical protein
MLPQQTSRNNDTAQRSPAVARLRDDDDVKLLDTIDTLRGLGIDKDIPLPQLVVVGEQDAGKSSVLEAISNIHFPTDSGACTRFATEVVLRRSTIPNIRASLLLHDEGTDAVSDSLQSKDSSVALAFSAALEDLKPLTADKIPQLIIEASNAMGLDKSNGFSEHILQLEISGPNQDHLTLIDLPGLFRRSANREDPGAPDLVRKLARRYISMDRSIILAVIHANTDYVTQDTLSLVEEVDPEGLRTLGIVTNLDQIPRGSSREAKFRTLAQNQDKKLRLGWHTLRNPSYEDRRESGFTRINFSKEDDFFQTEPWCQMPCSDRGAPALRKKLSSTLMKHIAAELDPVIAAINERIEHYKNTLKRVGQEHTTIRDKRIYLSQLAKRHEELVRDGLRASYSDNHDFFREKCHRFRTCLREQYDTYASQMQEAHSHDFWSQRRANEKLRSAKEIMELGPDEGKMFITLRREEYVSLVDALTADFRGQELPGSIDPKLIGHLFRYQSFHWKHVALTFFASVHEIVHSFMQSTIGHITDEHRARVIYDQHIAAMLKKRQKNLALKLDELVKAFIHKPPTTHNILYTQNCHRIREMHYSQEIKDGQFRESHNFAVSLEAFYELSRANFVDNVIILGVEMCLLDDLQDVFSQAVVENLQDHEIEDLTKELPEIARQRQTATEALIPLEEGRKACRVFKHDVRYKPTIVPESTEPKTPDRQRARQPRGFEGAFASISLDDASSASMSDSSPPTAQTTPDSRAPVPASPVRQKPRLRRRSQMQASTTASPEL